MIVNAGSDLAPTQLQNDGQNNARPTHQSARPRHQGSTGYSGHGYGVLAGKPGQPLRQRCIGTRNLAAAGQGPRRLSLGPAGTQALSLCRDAVEHLLLGCGGTGTALP